LSLRNKIIFGALIAVVLIAVLGFVLSGGGPVYAGLNVAASRTQVTITKHINDFGVIQTGTNIESVNIQVTGAPSEIGPDVHVFSLNESVASVHARPRAAGSNITTIDIIGNSSGQATIRVLTVGGGRTLDISVRVEVPARSLSVRDGVQFGVTRPLFGGDDAVLPFSQGDFNFFATPDGNPSFATTINTLEFSIIGNARGTYIQGNSLVVPALIAPDPGPVTIRATLTQANNPIDLDFTVFIFNPFLHLQVQEVRPTLQAPTYTPIASLVKNDINIGSDWVDYDILTSNWDPHDVPFGNGQVRFGFRFNNSNPHVAHINFQGEDSFRINANGIGSSDVELILFPIVTMPEGEFIFDRIQDARVHGRLPIGVEVRNVFTNDILRLSLGGNVIDNPNDSEIFAFYSADTVNLVRNPFNIVLSDPLVVNNTLHHSNNDHIKFEIHNRPAAIPSWIFAWDIFHITHTRHPLNLNHVVMRQNEFENGVPYWSNFTISINPRIALAHAGALINADDMFIRVRTVHECAGGLPLAYLDIDLVNVRAVHEITLSHANGDELDTLYPVVGGGTGAFEFFVGTDVNEISSDFVSFSHAEYFQVNQITMTPPYNILTGLRRIQYNIVVLSVHHSNASIIGQTFPITITYISGHSQTFYIEVLRQLTSLRVDVRNLSNGHVYFEPDPGADETTRMRDRTQDGIVNRIVTSFVRIDGTYSLDLTPTPTHASVWAEISHIGASLGNISIDPENFTFTPHTEGTFQLSIELFALNPEVLSGVINTVFNLTIVVVNPIIDASLDSNFITLFSFDTLSEMSGVPNNYVDSLHNLNINLTFARNLTGGNLPLAAPHISGSVLGDWVSITSLNPGNTSWEILGLRARGSQIEIEFSIHQTIVHNAETRVIGFTFDRPLVFVVNVVDAVTVQSIALADHGSYINLVMEGTNNTFPIRTSVQPANAHNPRLRFAFEVNGSVWDSSGNLITSVFNNSSEPIAQVNQYTGLITAFESNFIDDIEVVLVIFAVDSVRTSSLFTDYIFHTYLRRSVFIYDHRDPADGVFMISNLEQFLRHVMGHNNPSQSGQPINFGPGTGVLDFFDFRANGRDLSQGLRGHFRLTNDIDFGGVLLEPIPHFIGQFVGTSNIAVAGGGFERARYSLVNLNLHANQTSQLSRNTITNNFGLFAQIGDWNGSGTINVNRGLVDGVSFINVRYLHSLNRGIGSGISSNMGVVAAVNRGTIRDVNVHVEVGHYILNFGETLNMGAIVGLNQGQILETMSLNASGLLMVNHAGGTEGLNMGGLVGLNDVQGTIRGLNAADVLGENIVINSQVSLVYSAIVDIPGSTDRNVGGIAGRNQGTIDQVSSENFMYNQTRGNTGGLVGRNIGILQNSYSTSAMYGRGAIGGLVGWNDGTVRNSYFDFYFNQGVFENMHDVLRNRLSQIQRDQINWTGDGFYAALIVGAGASVPAGVGGFGVVPAVVGGIIGVNSGNVFNSFASSIFDNDTNFVFDTLPYRGDIYIISAQDVIVGGAIGRQLNTGGSNSNIHGVFSNMTIVYERPTQGVAAAGLMAGVFGGLIGELNAGIGSGVEIRASFAYNHFQVNNNRAGTLNITMGGLVGRNVSSTASNIDFVLCYAVLENDQLDTNGLINMTGMINPTTLAQAIGNGNMAGINHNSTRFGSANALFGGMMGLQLNTWTAVVGGSTVNANNYFINFSNINVIGMTHLLGNEAAFIDQMGGFRFPFIRTSFVSTNALFERPMFIAKPYEVELHLRTFEEYRETFRRTSNNRGGFNYVIGADNPPSDMPTAALFFTDAPFIPGNTNTANRYYLDDIFETEVSPAIASRRLRIEFVNNDGIAELGMSLQSGRPQYFIQLRRTGTFELHKISTRHAVEDPSITPIPTGKIRFNVVPGVTAQTVTHPAYSIIARQEMLFPMLQSGSTLVPVRNPNNFAHNFAMRKGTHFFLHGAVDSNAWGISARYMHATSGGWVNYDNGTMLEHFNTAMPTGVTFEFVPYIVVDGIRFYAEALRISLHVEIYEGAIELDIWQSETGSDATSQSIYSGRFITDARAPSDFTPAQWSTMNANEVARRNMLLRYLNFSFSHEGASQSLFLNDPTLPVALRYVDSNFNNQSTVRVSGQGRSFSLLFTLFVEELEQYGFIVGQGIYTYIEYRFHITMAIVVDESVFTDIGLNTSLQSAIPNGLLGSLNATERRINERHVLMYTSADVEIMPTVLQSVTLQHFAETDRVAIDGGAGHAVSLAPGQLQSNNILTNRIGDTFIGGMFKIYANPMFANIDSFLMWSSTFDMYLDTIVIGYDQQDEPIYKSVYMPWWVGLRQMVYCERTGNFVFLPQQAPNVEINVEGDNVNAQQMFQVSRLTMDGTYAWDGVYYIQTVLNRDLSQAHQYFGPMFDDMQLPQGISFGIGSRFESLGRTIDRSVQLFAQDRPGLYFNYDRPHTTSSLQAVGTTHAFTMQPIGPVGIEWGDIGKITVDRAPGPGTASVNHIGGQTYALTISPDFPIGADIVVIFEYTLERNGQSVTQFARMTITTVLFRVNGFELAATRGNTVRLQHGNRQDMQLGVIASRYNGFTGNDELMGRIDAAISTFETQINEYHGPEDRSEMLIWRGFGSGVGHHLNTGVRSADHDYYVNGVPSGELNFFLGRGSNLGGTKFISRSGTETRTTRLTVTMYYEFHVGGLVNAVSLAERHVTSTFNIQTVAGTAANNPEAITQPSQLIWLQDRPNDHFILMNDIVLNDHVPIVFNAQTFDGNNNRIFLNSFNISHDGGTTNIGLFSTITANRVIKNLNIVLPDRHSLTVNLSGHSTSGTVNVGVLAGTNHGIVTNVAILSPGQFVGGRVVDAGGRDVPIANFDRSAFNTNLPREGSPSELAVILGVAAGTGQQLTVNVGGLVGTNARGTATGSGATRGVISNSRVLINIYVGSEDREQVAPNIFRARVGGFVGVNQSHIVSSFFRDGIIRNHSMPRELPLPAQVGISMTGGFVALNGRLEGTALAGSATDPATIRASYAMGDSGNLDAFGHTQRGGIVSFHGVAGFVFRNAGGLVEDCYVNLIMQSELSSRDGFVAQNMAFSNTGVLQAEVGTVRNSIANNHEQPAGAQLATVFSRYITIMPGNVNVWGNLENNRFFINGGTHTADGASGARYNGITTITMTQMATFDNFSLSRMDEQGTPNIWQMTDFGPKLVSTDHIAVSIRIQEPFDFFGRNQISYLEGFEYGASRNNPIVIWNGAQFNTLLFESTGAYMADIVGGDVDWEMFVSTNYFRLINNISLAQGDLSAELGHRLLTHQIILRGGELDGNGLNIRNISINAAPQTGRGLQSVGLFSRLEYATIKNVNMHFVRVPIGGIDIQNSTIYAPAAIFAGGLAGISVNSNIVDVNIINAAPSLDAGHTFIRGGHIVGGLVGAVANFEHNGNAGETYKIENVFVNVPTITGISSGSFDNGIGYTYLNFNQQRVAGGLIGVITHDVRNTTRGVNRNAAFSHLFMRDINGDYLVPAQVRPLANATHFNVNRVGNIQPGIGVFTTNNVTGDVAGGLFGIVEEEIRINRANNMFAATNLSARYYAGGIVGINLGYVTTSQVGNTLNILSRVSTAVPLSERYVFYGEGSINTRNIRGMIAGGITGFNSGEIQNATVNSAIVNPNLMAVGGIAGENVGGTINNSTVNGRVWGGLNVGGLVGINSNGGNLSNNTISHVAIHGQASGIMANVSIAYALNNNTQVNTIFTSSLERMTAFGINFPWTRAPFTGTIVGAIFEGNPNVPPITFTGTTRFFGYAYWGGGPVWI